MQLILDADDIDIKGNMSTIEQESLNEKFLANKIIDHLADDVSNGNKENIQKQDNIIPDPSENDITDTDKEIATGNVILTDNLNEQSSNEAIVDTENIENLEDVVSQIDSCETNLERVSEDTIVESVDNIKESQDNVILEKEQKVDAIQQEVEIENEPNISHDKYSTIDECLTQEKNNDVELITKENEENQANVEENATIKITSAVKEDKELNLDESDSVKCVTEKQEEEEVNLDEGDSVQCITEEKEEKEINLDEGDSIKCITGEKEEKELNKDEDDSVKYTTGEKEEKEVNLDEDDSVKCITGKKEEKEVNLDEGDSVKCITGKKEEKEVNLDEGDSVQCITEEKEENGNKCHAEELLTIKDKEIPVDIDKVSDVEVIFEEKVKNEEDIEKENVHEVHTVTATPEDITEKQADVIGNVSVEVTTEKRENHAVFDEDVDTVAKDLIEGTDQTNISNTEIDNTDKEMEFSVTELNQINSLNENNTPIEIDDEDEKSIEKSSSPITEVLALDENMEVDETEEEGTLEGQELHASPQNNIISEEPKSPQKEAEVVKTVEEEPKRICKLSNNLDIFSDEEEDSNNAESPKDDTPPTTEKCISIDDDDDIMLIDEISEEKDKDNAIIDNEIKITSDNIEPVLENTINENVCTDSVQVEENVPKDILEPNEPDISDASKITEPEQILTNDVPATKTGEVLLDKVQDAKQVKKPLLPKHFIKTCKKNLADMTRDDLEDFCVLKIVESIVDRSNLGEIKTQLKNLTQTMDECKKKCLMLSKQNKDLQVVLKSVQEEQKSMPDVHVTPPKITRSVGMQVVMMVDKNNIRKKSVNGVGSSASLGSTTTQHNNTTVKPTKSLPTPNTRSKEKTTNNQQIPVPRLVPAVTTAKTNQTVTNNIASKLNNVAINPCIPNGVRNSPPVQKATEKRPRSQAVTVDLTDDEPPAKLPTMQRGGVSQAMRVSSTPPNILQPQRFSPASMNSPRKVYIPISGAQAQNVRAGQTIMLKTVPAIGPRQRCPTPHVGKIPQNANQLRMGRIPPGRHPAPLPDVMKQYQPPNWKALPPAPDLKLSKVENGIVISWRIDGYQEENHEEIASYQLYAYQETTAPPSTALWKKIGDVKALPLPMACTLTQFMAGYKYYFAVRAVDIRTRFGPFSPPGSILLLNKV